MTEIMCNKVTNCLTNKGLITCVAAVIDDASGLTVIYSVYSMAGRPEDTGLASHRGSYQPVPRYR